MTAAIYTRETIAYLRSHAESKTDGALAAHLEWPVDRVRRVAKAHGITLTGGGHHANLAPTATPSLADNLRSVIAFAPAPVTTEPAARPLDDLVARLPKRQAQILCVLRDAEEAISGHEIGARLTPPMAGENSYVYIFALRAKLRGSGWSLESQKGPGGGYRLMRDK